MLAFWQLGPYKQNKETILKKMYLQMSSAKAAIFLGLDALIS